MESATARFLSRTRIRAPVGPAVVPEISLRVRHVRASLSEIPNTEGTRIVAVYRRAQHPGNALTTF